MGRRAKRSALAAAPLSMCAGAEASISSFISAPGGHLEEDAGTNLATEGEPIRRNTGELIWTTDQAPLWSGERPAQTLLEQVELDQHKLAQNPFQTIQINEHTYSRFDQVQSWTIDPETGSATINNAAGQSITVPSGSWALETSSGSILTDVSAAGATGQIYVNIPGVAGGGIGISSGMGLAGLGLFTSVLSRLGGNQSNEGNGEDGGSSNQSPIFINGPSVAANFAENATGTVYKASARDDDNDTVGYSFAGGADDALFQIDPNSGALTFMSLPDFETKLDADTNNVYEVKIQANDGKGGIAIQTVLVEVTDVEDFALQLNQQSAALFGNDGTTLDNGIFEGVSDADGKLVVTFVGDGTDYLLKYLAHDMDNSGHPPGEMSISLNGAPIGYVPETTPDMSTAQVQTGLPASYQVIGYNVLEFQNINPSFNWGLGQFLLTDILV